MLPPALVAGPVFGLLAVLFMLAIRYSAAFAARSGWSPSPSVADSCDWYWRNWHIHSRGSGAGNVDLASMLDGGFDPFICWYSFLLLLLTALCIGFGLFGGVFSPALFWRGRRGCDGSDHGWHNGFLGQ